MKQGCDLCYTLSLVPGLRERDGTVQETTFGEFLDLGFKIISFNYIISIYS